MKKNPLPRLDQARELRARLLPVCRLQAGQVWVDPEGKHRVGCIDAADPRQVGALVGNQPIQLAIHDPPYNLAAFDELPLEHYVEWCRRWICITLQHLAENASLYLWLGADQNDGFQPLPDVMLMMREMQDVEPRSFITMRNQRGYGTQNNWMAIRQELLYHIKGKPPFYVQYTDIRKNSTRLLQRSGGRND